MKGNLLQTSLENTKKQQEDAGMFMKEQSEETQEQQTKDKIERWMAQVRVERSEAEFLQVRMQKNKNEHDATALQALQAAEQARKRAAAATPIGAATAERARTTAELQRLRYLDSAAGEALVFISFFLLTDLNELTRRTISI